MIKASWQAITEFDIATCVMEGEWLLFHSGTGATHRLNGIYGLVFEAFWTDKSPVNITDLITSTSRICHLEINEIKQAVEALLTLRLIKRVDQFN